MTRFGRAVAVAVAIVVGLSVGGSAAASPPAKSAAPANINPAKHPVTDPAQLRRQPSVPPTDSAALRRARDWAAEEPLARFVCVTSDGALATAGILDRADPSRPPTAAQLAELCRLGGPGSSLVNLGATGSMRRLPRDGRTPPAA